MFAMSMQDRIRTLVTRVMQFALVSGAGLALDFGLFIGLTQSGIGPGFSNFISASVAVTFVYFVSVKKIFAYQGQFLFGLFAAYLVYQATAVVAASLAVEYLTVGTALSAVWSKIVILPVTFGANFLFMSWLTREKP